MSVIPISMPLVFGAIQESSVSGQVSFIVLGFLFVVIVLASLAAITSFVGLGFRQLAPPTPQTEAPSQTKAAPPPPPADETSTSEESALFQNHENPEHIPALIAAAAHAALAGRPHRIIAIRKPSQHWAQEGRREIFKSHQVR